MGPAGVVEERRARGRGWHGAIAILTACALVSAGALAKPGVAEDPPPKPPNILILVTDDQRHGTMRAMPKTRRIFKRGVRFSRGMVTTPLCCPSRVSIFTGQYVHNHRVRGTRSFEHHDPTKALPYHLRQAGYRMAVFGKFLRGPLRRQRPPYFNRAFTAASADWDLHHPRQDYFHAGLAVDFLRDHAARSPHRPWALFVNFRSPHVPYIPARRYRNAKVPGRFPLNRAMLERDFSDKNPALRKARTPWDRGAAERMWRGHQRMMMSVDDGVARIFKQLRRSGTIGDTLAFYISDNGFYWGEHGIRHGKFLPYRMSVEVPFYMRWPGRVEPGVDSRLAANIDIAPTIYDATGITPDYTPDGRSLLGANRRSWLLLEGPDRSSLGWPRWRHAYWDGRHHFIRWRNGHEEYYDLRADPWQLEGRFVRGPGDGTRAKVAPFRRALDAAARCAGASCP